MSSRYYDTPYGKLPSVTTVLSIIDKPALLRWVAKEAREATIKAVWGMIVDAWQGGFDLGNFDYKKLYETISHAVNEYQRKQKTALDIGSFVHNCIECWYKLWEGSRVEYFAFIQEYYPNHPNAVYMLHAYFDCLRIHNIKVTTSEMTVWSNKGYAVTLDLIAEISGIMAVGDIKTTKKIKPTKKALKENPYLVLFYFDQWLQLEAYLRAAIFMKLISGISKKFIIRLDKENPGTFEYQLRDSSNEDFEAFVAAMILWKRSKNEKV